VVSAHGLKIEPCPSEADLLVFQSFLEILDKTFELDSVICHAVKKAFHNKSRRLWCTGDQVQILKGTFMDTLCSIHEIDKDN
jgi:transcription antitermination factor NusG